jgi:hypothetical protein
LILPSTSLLAFSARTTKSSIRTSIITIRRQRKLNCDFVLARQIGVRDLRIWYFKGWTV